MNKRSLQVELSSRKVVSKILKPIGRITNPYTETAHIQYTHSNKETNAKNILDNECVYQNSV